MTPRSPVLMSLTIGALLAITSSSADAQQSSSDLGKGALAQCWTTTVKVMTMMEGGLLDPPLSAEQQESLYAAIEARDGENYGECVKKLKDMPTVFG